MSELLPSVQAAEVRRGLLDYLTTTFALADADAQVALREFLGDPVDGMFKGPYVRLRLPFRPADSGWQRHVGWDIGFTPYGHQAQAFARLSSANPDPDAPVASMVRPAPTLITTGTGSGKTEAFLIPILDHALRARRAGVTGMKALILYPMNALANDQAARLARLLTSREELAGITAALYTGQDTITRTTVTAEGLITDRAVIRQSPPDILLTNYKMLDQLLLRHEDQPLWRASATSVQYLVLDEFHTYDGAQGTDVAMLLRRLGLALKSAWAEDDPSVTVADRAWPLGRITPVATSATLGDQGDPGVMRDFAHTVFGEWFDDASVVTEARLSVAEWVADAGAWVWAVGLSPLPVEQIDIARIMTALAAVPEVDPWARALVLLDGLYSPWSDELGGCVDQHLLDQLPEGALTLLKAHPLLHTMVVETEQAVSLADLILRCFGAGATIGGAGAPPYERFLVEVLAVLSQVRATMGRDALTVELHLWVRELTRVDRLASDTATYLWSDDGVMTVSGVDDPYEWQGRPAFPAVYCRHCGRSGWGVGLAPTGSDLDSNDAVIRRNHAAREGRFRALLFARAEADHTVGGREPEVEGLRWFEVRRRAILATPPEEDDADLRDGWVLPVLMLTGLDADDDSRDDKCPSCQRPDGIRFLGSAIATLLSVTMSTLFGSKVLDPAEKKALVFTDSVQDAAHRAAFVESRSHTLTLRSILREAVGDAPITLDELAEEAVRSAGDDPFLRYRLLAPDLVDREEFRPFWQTTTARSVPVSVRKRVRRRVLFDAMLEFGLQSRVGRTLEQTGAVAVEVEAGAASRLATIARRVLAATDTQDTLDGNLASISDARLTAWVRGVLEHLRERGAVYHEWFAKYIAEDGVRFRIWGGRPRNQGMPAFPRGRSAPGFPRIGPALPSTQDLLEPVTSSQSWHARWAARLLGVAPQHGAALARRLLDYLARENILLSYPTRTKGTVYAIPASAIVIAPTSVDALVAGDNLLTCTVCHNQFPGTATVTAQLDQAPCLLVRCPGILTRTSRKDNFYRTLYGTGGMRRIVAREHSSLLDDPTRLEYESGFKLGQDNPHAPNVLVATPTLEMGIDIGDLSTVMLGSLPRTVASYLQRVGRAGRLTGNALNLAFVTGRGEHLPRLGDPLSIVNGQVRPPATYLDAEEILQRQYLAHLVDRFARDNTRPHPHRATGVFANIGPGTFLGDLIATAERDATQLLEEFLNAFTTISDSARETLRTWATPTDGPGSSGLATHLYRASQRWAATVAELEYRRRAIEKALPELHQIASLPAATDDDRRAERSAHATMKLARSQLRHLRGQYWIQVLEECGILPNYTLLDDSVTLDVSLSWVDPDTQEFRSEPSSYIRGATNALREFAPGAVFYARGTEIIIDAVDLGADAEAVRTWAFCPACGYAVDLEIAGVNTCPRCGNIGIRDTRQHLDVVELTRVSAEMRRDEAAIGDRRDDRRREHFTIFTAADIDPAAVSTQWYVDGYDFGAKYLKRLTIRWLNAGRESGFGPTRTIAGDEHPAGLFRVCAGCGKLDTNSRTNSRTRSRTSSTTSSPTSSRADSRSNSRTNRSHEHRAWCQYRTDRTEHVRTIALSRTLTTQGVVLSLPLSITLGDRFAVPSLSAALMLGLREQLGGSPDHIHIAQIHDPAVTPGSGPAVTPGSGLAVTPGSGLAVTPGSGSDGGPGPGGGSAVTPGSGSGLSSGQSTEALLLHDVVPGGTGYLAELANPEQIYAIMYRAWLVVRSCPCRDEPRLACHRCLLPLAPPWQVDLVSREAAERHLRTLLTSGRSDGTQEEPAADLDWILSEIPTQSADIESHLEQHFRAVFTTRLRDLGATVKETPGPNGNRLIITFPRTTRHWTLDPQVLAATSRPDFVLQSSDQTIPRIAIFTDGWRYHASTAHNRLADDARKRADLRDAGYVVLAVTAQDLQDIQNIQNIQDPHSGTATAPSWLRTDVIATVLGSGQFTFSPHVVETVKGGPLAFLLAWIQNPDISAYRAFADALPLIFAVGAEHFPLEPGTDLAHYAAERLTTGTSATVPPAASGQCAWWWRCGAVGMLARTVTGNWIETAIILDDRADSLETDNHRAAWATWLSISNAMALRQQPTSIDVVTTAGDTPIEPAEPMTVTGLPPAWQAIVDLAAANDAEKAFVSDLARVSVSVSASIPVPILGHETTDGIPIDFAWPDRKVAVYISPTNEDRDDLQAAGWTVLAAEPDIVTHALTGHTVSPGSAVSFESAVLLESERMS